MEKHIQRAIDNLDLPGDTKEKFQKQWSTLEQLEFLPETRLVFSQICRHLGQQLDIIDRLFDGKKYMRYSRPYYEPFYKPFGGEIATSTDAPMPKNWDEAMKFFASNLVLRTAFAPPAASKPKPKFPGSDHPEIKSVKIPDEEWLKEKGYAIARFGYVRRRCNPNPSHLNYITDEAWLVPDGDIILAKGTACSRDSLALSKRRIILKKVDPYPGFDDPDRLTIVKPSDEFLKNNSVRIVAFREPKVDQYGVVCEWWVNLYGDHIYGRRPECLEPAAPNKNWFRGKRYIVAPRYSVA